MMEVQAEHAEIVIGEPEPPILGDPRYVEPEPDPVSEEGV